MATPTLFNIRKYLVTQPINYHSGYWGRVFPVFPATGAMLGYGLSSLLGGDGIDGALALTVQFGLFGVLYAFIPPVLVIGVAGSTAGLITYKMKNENENNIHSNKTFEVPKN